MVYLYIEAISFLKTKKAIFSLSGNLKLIHIELPYTYTQGLE